MEYRYDIHVHSSEVSWCGQSTAEDQVKAFAGKGYSGVMFTDHYTAEWFNSQKDKSTWDEKIDEYLSGYKSAVATAQKLDVPFDVIMGSEIRFEENGNDYLVFGVTEELLKKHKELYKLGIKKFKKFCEEHDLLVMQAHPFREWCIVQPAEYMDGIETENAHEGHNNNNGKAREYARLNNLREIGGGDCHDCTQAGHAGIIVNKRIHNSTELKEILAHDEYELIHVTNF